MSRHFKKEEIVDAIVKMRCEKLASSKTIIKDFLMNELGYGSTYSYELYNLALQKIKEYYKEYNTAAIENSIAQMEEMMEECKKNRNYKQAFEIRKEINKILGLYIEKIDITSGGQPINLKDLFNFKDDTNK